jgi:serine/threonine protein kinase
MNTGRLRAVADIAGAKYRILDRIGHGQFGQVFCGIHRQTGQLVALKELHSRQLTTPQFLHELNLLTSLQHPNIVAFHTLEYSETKRYLVMDYCEGGTLRALIDTPGPLDLSQSLQLVTDIVQALAYAHEHGVVHCDLKPENVLLTLTETGWKAHLADFGIARLLLEAGPSFQQGDTGSPAYMAPERFYSNYGPTSDLYAVGVLLYELVVGQRPFSGTPGALMTAHLNQPIEIPATVPFLVRSIIQQAMQKLPQNRFMSAQEMLVSLRLAREVAAALPMPFSSAHTLQAPQILHQEVVTSPVSGAADIQRLYPGLDSQIDCRLLTEANVGKVIQSYKVDGPITPTQLLALNRRHGLAVFPDAQKGTRLQLFNRRGNTLDYCRLPMPIQNVVRSQTHSYRVLALSSAEAAVALLIDLKPLQIRRIALPLSPAFTGATEGGYWFADQDRQVALIDEYGRLLGQLEIPQGSKMPTAACESLESREDGMETLTAIASVNRILIAATWSGQQGQLYTFDLKPWFEEHQTSEAI